MLSDITFIIMLHLCMALLSLVIFGLLLNKYLGNKEKNLAIHSMIRVLAFLTFFLFIDGAYYSLLYASENGLIPLLWYYRLSEPAVRVIPILGIFLSTVMLVYFLMDRKIEYFKDSEVSFQKIKKLNEELEKRATELESTQDKLIGKLKELERFNEIAKQREVKMIELIKKIETLETKLKKEKKA